MNNVFLGLGSNIYPRVYYIYSALNAVEKNLGVIKNISSVYQTKAWKMPDDTPFFYNLCVFIQTPFNPQKILSDIYLIEKNLGRTKKIHKHRQYESRSIDIDILLFNDEIIQESNLTIPHPYLHEREFVLQPLAEIAADVIHPVLKKKIKELIK